MPSSILEVITHYQKSIEKSTHDEKRLLHCIEKLCKLPVSVAHLQTTGVGKTVNSLRKYNNEVGVAAKSLVTKWKAMVAAEENTVESDNEEKSSSYYDDVRESGNENRNEKSINKINNSMTSISNYNSSNNVSSHSSLLNDKSHKSHSRKSGEEKDYVKKRKLDYDSNNSNNEKEHHKKSRKDYEKNISSSKSHFDSKSDKTYKSELVSNGIQQNYLINSGDNLQKVIKKEKLEPMSDDNDDQTNTEYDDGEKLVIDVKIKSEDSESDTNDDGKQIPTIRDGKKHHNHNTATKESSSGKDKENNDNKKESSNASKIKESTEKRGDSQDRKSNHHKSRHGDDKKSRHDKEKKNSSQHHRTKDDENRHKIKQKDEKKEKEKNREKNERERERKKDKSSSSKSSSDRHHSDRKKNSSSTSGVNIEDNKEKLKRKISIDSDVKSISSPSNSKVVKVIENGIDSSMGTSFEEALGMLNASSSSSSSSAAAKSSSKSKSKPFGSSSSTDNNQKDDNFAKPSTSSQSSSSSSSKNKINTPELLTSTAKLIPLDPNIALELPTISPNYKPMPLNPTVMDCVFNNKQQQQPQRRMLTDEEALAAGISSKTVRTKVYSGSKTGQFHQVPSLFDLCIWVLQKNIDCIEYTGGVPFDIIKQVLEIATPTQLLNLEEYNPYLMEDTDILWERICARHCKGVKRQEMETWREMYLRCVEEREERLSKLTENIKQSQKQITQPVRKTQLAYIDSMVKPPRNIQRKQEQFGTSHKKVTTPAARVASLSGIAPNIFKAAEHKVRINPSERDTAQATAHSRPKKAPLMQKTLQLMKGRFKR